VPVIALALKSLWNRRTTAALTITAIAISVTLLLGVQQLRTAAREGFASTISGADLIVGARSGPINLLLYSIFRIGDATANVTWQSYQKIAKHPDVAWAIPISLGDSHQGFRVMGTTLDYFAHYRFAGDRQLAFAVGSAWTDLYDTVLGADVASQLHYRVGEAIVLAHGIGNTSFAQHKDKPFRVAGILQRTGTPVDRTVHVSLEAITAIHIDWQTGMQAPVGSRISADAARHKDLTPDSITAFILGMKSKVTVFLMQRAIDEYTEEPLLAIIPGVALQQLWSLVGVADQALLLIAACVVLAGLLGMLTAILTSLKERRREMAILRSVGARPQHIFLLLTLEAGFLALSGVLLGTVLSFGLLIGAQRFVIDHFGIVLTVTRLRLTEIEILAGIVLAALAMGTVPAWRAYRNALADGLTIRV
jgi:putative ABC transport system permease protein